MNSQLLRRLVRSSSRTPCCVVNTWRSEARQMLSGCGDREHDDNSVEGGKARHDQHEVGDKVDKRLRLYGRQADERSR